jgi:UDP-N-acetylglucosamine:LPS N-acetylglucosamine transferase
MNKNKICLICGPGGHLDEMLCLLDAFKGSNFFFITVAATTSIDLTKIARTYYFRNRFPYGERISRIKILIFTLIYLILISLIQFRILLKERPSIIVTTGGDETIPACYIGKILGAKIICVESITRIYHPSGTGKILYPISDLFLVQWESLLKKYGKKAQYFGKVI